MEFNEKLQELRKQKNLTQEELAQSLYISRTAVSKWESGRGLPSIDSLKAISRFFAISLDDLLSGDDLLEIAERDIKERDGRNREVVFSLLDMGMILLAILPLFGQRAESGVVSVTLMYLTGVPRYLLFAYFAVIFVTVLLGAAGFPFAKRRWKWWNAVQCVLSLGLSIAAVLLFILSRQVYAAVFCFIFFAIKAILFKKK